MHPVKLFSVVITSTCTLILFFMAGCGTRHPGTPEAVGPLPTGQQLAWHQLEYVAFVHFNMNTFTDKEWGYGDEDPRVFNPEALDCRQWVRIFKQAGMKGVILTAKHHDGFCLWPSAYSEHSVKNATWKDGKGDVLRELADACQEYDLKLGFYLSPWDRNHAEYGLPAYLDYFRNQLQEILTAYGDVFEVWFDGANGGDGYYGGAREIRKIDRESYYHWEEINELVLGLQPDAIIFSDNGPGARWIGNEQGFAGETNWNLLNPADIVIGGTGGQGDKITLLNEGDEQGTAWIPGEADVSIRPGWYYHQAQDTLVKSTARLMDIYYKSIGRGANLLLNIPVDDRGLVHQNDSAALMEFKKARDRAFAIDLARQAGVEASNVRNDHPAFAASNVLDDDPSTYWATDKDTIQATLSLQFRKPVTCNTLVLQEYIPLGQRVRSFKVEVLAGNKWIEVAQGTTIGYKRMVRFPTMESTAIRVVLLNAKGSPLISKVSIFSTT